MDILREGNQYLWSMDFLTHCSCYLSNSIYSEIIGKLSYDHPTNFKVSLVFLALPKGITPINKVISFHYHFLFRLSASCFFKGEAMVVHF